MTPSSPTNPYTRAVAEFVSGLRGDAIPSEVWDRLKLQMLDSYGCGIFGANLPWSRILQRTLHQFDSGDQVAVWGTNQRISAPHAALINGAQVQGFELDDVHRRGVLHVGAVTLPAVTALAERHVDLTGAEFLTAVLAGYEIGPRVGICMGQEHIGQGWHSGATVGVFSAAAGAARALGLDADRTVNALGIAGTQSAGLMAAQYGAMVKRMHAGRSSQSGLYGAILAEGGFTGIQDVFEAPYGGFCTTFSRSTDRFDLEELRSGLGDRFETMHITLKFYSCVGSNHTTLDAIKEIQKRRPFGPDDFEKIVVHASQVTVDHAGWPYRPEGLTSAQLNLQFCVATLLLEGDVFVEQFPEGIETDPRRLELLQKVEVVHDPEITRLGARFRHKVRVEVHFPDGSIETMVKEAPVVNETSFASADAVIEKFRKLTKVSLSERHQDSIVEAVMGLERLASARELTSLLALP